MRQSDVCTEGALGNSRYPTGPIRPCQNPVFCMIFNQFRWRFPYTVYLGDSLDVPMVSNGLPCWFPSSLRWRKPPGLHLCDRTAAGNHQVHDSSRITRRNLRIFKCSIHLFVLRMLDRDTVQIANPLVTPGGFFRWCDHWGFQWRCDCHYTRMFFHRCSRGGFLRGCDCRYIRRFFCRCSLGGFHRGCDSSVFNPKVSSTERSLAVKNYILVYWSFFEVCRTIGVRSPRMRRKCPMMRGCFHQVRLYCYSLRYDLHCWCIMRCHVLFDDKYDQPRDSLYCKASNECMSHSFHNSSSSISNRCASFSMSRLRLLFRRSCYVNQNLW